MIWVDKLGQRGGDHGEVCVSTIGFLCVRWTVRGNLNYFPHALTKRDGHWVRRPQKQKTRSRLAEVGSEVVVEEAETEPDLFCRLEFHPQEESYEIQESESQHGDACPRDMSGSLSQRISSSHRRMTTDSEERDAPVSPSFPPITPQEKGIRERPG